jgi:deazaflavin-dependent oxidoreductase (nitroreductase family)
MLYYLPAAAGYAVVASNAGATYPPAWWLNLQASPEAVVDLPAGAVRVRPRMTADPERAELWRRFVACLETYERYAETAERDIPIVVLEPIDEEPDA